MSILGLLLAFAPGTDGATIATRAARARSWFSWARSRPAWQLAGAILAVAAAALLITRPNDLFYWVGADPRGRGLLRRVRRELGTGRGDSARPADSPDTQASDRCRRSGHARLHR